MASSQLQFKVGDMAVYPVRGVGEIVSIEEKSIAGTASQKYYVLKILDTDVKAWVPVEQAKEYGLRPPITEEDITELFLILKEQTIVFDNQTWNRRRRGFMEKIETGSVFDITEVMRDLYCLRKEKSLSFGEKRMLERARNLIVKEVAVARSVDDDEVLAEIESLFDSEDVED